MITATTTKQDKVLPPTGTHIARVYQIIHIGTTEYEWQGEKKKRNRVRIGFELPTEKHVFKEELGEQPFVISHYYTLSLGEKANLRKIVEGILGRTLNDDELSEFDVESLLGKTCLVTITHRTTDTGVYANIQSTSPLIKGMTAPSAINKPFVLNYDSWSQEAFDSLPSFLREEMMSSEEYRKKFGDNSAPNPEDIPF